MPAEESIPGSARLRDLVLLALGVDAEGWRVRHPSPVLLYKPVEDLDPEEEAMDFYTRVADPSSLGSTLEGQVESSWIAIPIEKRSVGTYAAQISVGRTPNVDIFLPMAGLSKFHAYFQTDGPLSWSLTDFASTNGTFVGNLQLPPRTPRPLTDGDILRFGEHPFRFLLPETLHGLLRKVH